MANTTTIRTVTQHATEITPADASARYATSRALHFTERLSHGDLSLGRQAVLKDLHRYLQALYTTLIHLAFGAPADILRIRTKLTQDHILETEGEQSQWAGFATPPTQSNISKNVTFRLLMDMISNIFD